MEHCLDDRLYGPVKALTKPGKMWFGAAYSQIFCYDDANKRLYYYRNDDESEIQDALKEPDFKGDWKWNIVYQDPENPKVFWGHYNYRYTKFEILDDSTIQQLDYLYQKGKKYYRYDDEEATPTTYVLK